MPGVFLLAPGPVFIDPDQQTVHNNAAVTTSGSEVYTGFGVRDLILVVNITAAPTGTSPSIVYTLQEVDPGDEVTPVGSSITGVALTGVGTQVLNLPLTVTGAIQVSWEITGAGADFTGVYATLTTKITTVQSGLDPSGVERPVLVDMLGRSAVIDPPDFGAGQGLSLINDPITGDPTSNIANNTGPVTATLSNTTAGYLNLGGKFQFATPAGSEDDYALFAYQVPPGYFLYVDSIGIGSFITGNKSSTSATMLEWSAGANSTAVSLATPSPDGPTFFALGSHAAVVGSVIGDTFLPGNLIYAPRTPIVVKPTRYFHIVLRVPLGNPTPRQTIRGFVNIAGFFQPT
jgi:hypothetical protein